MKAPESSSKSIRAYQLPERVVAYDADMDIMHPLRHKMIEVMLDLLPLDNADAPVAIDLGVGTGVLAQRLLERFASAKIVAIDGAEPMVELAKARLGDLCDRARFVVCDFRELPDDLSGKVDAIVSSYALHHLNAVGFRFVPYYVWSGYRGRKKWLVKCHDECVLDDEGLIHDTIKMYYWGLQVATMHLVLKVNREPADE